MRIATTNKSHNRQVDAMRKRGYVTVDEAAEMIMVSRATIYGWLKDGTLACERVGKRALYVPLDAVRQVMGPLGTKP